MKHPSVRRDSLAAGLFVVFTTACATEPESPPVHTETSVTELRHVDIPSGLFGAALAGVGDVDGDGRGDLLVGAPASHDDAGSVWLFSACEGRVLFKAIGEHAARPIAELGVAVGSEYGASVAALGDCDGDRVPDFAVGKGAEWLAGESYVDVWSGRTFERLARIDGATLGARIGSAIAGMGDLDGDGAPEVLLADRGARDFRALVVSTKTGKLVRSFDRPKLDGARTPRDDGKPSGSGVLACAGDTDGDGRGDILVGWRPTARELAVVDLYSGADGRLLRRFEGGPEESDFGRSLSSAGDFDGDGRDDVTIGYPRESYRDTDRAPMALRIFSGASGELLFEDRWDALVAPSGEMMTGGEHYASGFAHAFAAGGDVDRDGRGDLWMSFPTRLPHGELRRYSSLYRSVRLVVRGDEAPEARFGETLCGAGDIDADGVSDIAVAALDAGSPSSPSVVDVLSGKTGRRFRRLEFVDGEARVAKFEPRPLPNEFVGRFEKSATDVGDAVELSADGRYSWEYRYRTLRYEKGTVRVVGDWLVFDVETREEYMPPGATMRDERACVLVWRDRRFLVRESRMAAFCNMLNSSSTVRLGTFLCEKTKRSLSPDYTPPQLPSPYDRYRFTEPLIATLLSTGRLIPDGTTSNREFECDVGAAEGAWKGMNLFLLNVPEEFPSVPRAWLTEIGEHTSKGRMPWWERNLDAMPSVGRKFSTRDPRAKAP